MRLKVILFLFVVTFFGMSAFSWINTKGTSGYKFEVLSSRTGDLNKDGLADSVVVLQQKSEDNISYLLKIFFKQKTGGYSLNVSSTTAVLPANLSGGDAFGEITISNNVLILTYDLLRGHYDHKFRYKQGNFELIGYTFDFSDGRGTSYDVDFNLSTGKYVKKNYNYETDSLIKQIDTIIRIRPLPKLQNFTPQTASYNNFNPDDMAIVSGSILEHFF